MKNKLFGSPKEIIDWLKSNSTTKKQNPTPEISQSSRNTRPGPPSTSSRAHPPPPPISSTSGTSGRSHPPPPPPPISQSWSQNAATNPTKKSSRFSDA